MSIPDFQSIMLPLLKLAADGQEWSIKEATRKMAEHFKLTPEEQQELLPSGSEGRFPNRVSWARTYLKMAGLMEYPARGRFKITQRGREVLTRNIPNIDIRFLNQFPDFNATRRTGNRPLLQHDVQVVEPDVSVVSKSPEELIESAYNSMHDRLATELVDQIKHCSPAFFEKLVVNLLVKMGYGGSIQDAGQAIGRSGDEGIDGIIKEDRLGLDAVYIQAKRWENTVGRPQIQSFVGALHGKSNKGVFMTTSNFSKDALDYARALGNTKVILIDGTELADLMIEHNIGITTKQTYEIKKIDFDYFSEEE